MSSLEQLIRSYPPYDAEAVPVDTAQSVIRAFVQPVQEKERVALRQSLGRVLAEDLVSPIDVPSYDNSAMDGWAVRSRDLSKEREVALAQVGIALAGRPFGGEVQAGQCVRVMTGAVMPKGADTVVVQEAVRAQGDRVVIPPGQRAGQNRRLAGEDLNKGTPALFKGTLLRPADVGLLASLGIAQVPVSRRLRVAFFSTGDELRSLDSVAALAPGELYDSNRYTMAAMLERLGCELADFGVVRDDPAALEATLRKAAAGSDAVMTTGGVAEGDADFTRKMMSRLAQTVFWKLAMRPGRPFTFGRFHEDVGSAYLFGLPGNPVATMVAFYQLVRPALLARMGCRHCEPPLVQVKAQCAMPKRAGRTEYHRGVLENQDGEWTVRLTGPQGSGILRSMSEANCFVVLRPEQASVEAGERVQVMMLEGLV
jgi:molybdopterin molybdotransferase